MEQTALFAAGDLICELCGGTSPNYYIFELNHHQFPNDKRYCLSRRLVMSQIIFARDRGDHEWANERLARARELRLTETDIEAWRRERHQR